MISMTDAGLVVPDMPEGGIILPPGVAIDTPDDEFLEKETTEDREVRMASQLPIPTGYKILIALPEVSEMTNSGLLVKASTAIDLERVATVTGYVVALGPDAYADKDRYPSGPYCEQGDWVVIRAFSGTRIKVHGQEFRLINDDSVEATVEDPQGVERT